MEMPKILLYNPAVMEAPRCSTESDYERLDLFDTITTVSNHCSGGFVASASQRRVASLQESQMTQRTNRGKYRVLTTTTLVGIVYFTSCGGPVGSEPLISSGGPLLGFLGILVYVVFCLTPLLCAVTELCCSFPENGGHAVWVMTAFGPFWGFQNGYWSWVASMFNGAIFPGLIFSTIADACNVEVTCGITKFFIKAAIAIVLAVPNYFGVRAIGVGSLVLLVCVMACVMVIAVWSAVETDGAWYVLKEVRGSEEVSSDTSAVGIDWTLLINMVVWNFDGMYSISVVGGEIMNPARSFPRVMTISGVLFLVTYLVPWTFILAANKASWRDIAEDSLPDVTGAIGGSTLRHITLACYILGSIGLYTCSLFYQSFLVQGMAQARLLPSALRKRSARFKAPLYATHFSLITTLALVGFEFEKILNMTNAFSGMLQILVVLSAIQIRRKFPHLSRPWRMPGNLAVVTIALVPVTCVFCFLIYSTFKQQDLALIGAAFIFPGLVFPFLHAQLVGSSVNCC